MASKSKLITTTAIATLLFGGAAALLSGKGSFVKAQGITRTYDIVSLICDAMTNDADQVVEIEYHDATFKYKLHNVTKSGDSLVITNGYIYNLTALNGLSYVEVTGSGTTGANYTQILGSVETLASEENIVKGIASSKLKAPGKIVNSYEATNFSVLANESPVTVSEIKVCYTCETGDSELVDTEGLKFTNDFVLNSDSATGNSINLYCVDDYRVFANQLAIPGNTFENYTVNLCDDISLTQPYMKSSYEFRGVFEGNDNTVTMNFNYSDFSSSGVDTVSFLPKVEEGGVVRNLYVEGEVTNAGSYAGLLTSSIDSTEGIEIYNVYINGDISGSDYVGLLAGSVKVDNPIIVETVPVDPIHDIEVVGSATGSNYVGGLVGKAACAISSINASVIVEGNNSVGGIIGQGELNVCISDSEYYGSTSGASGVGGIMGKRVVLSTANTNTRSIVGCDVAEGSAIIGTSNVGGVVGSTQDVIYNCSVTSSTISGTSNVGGVVGVRSGNDQDTDINYIDSCNVYGTTSVTSTGDYTGGIVGAVWGKVYNCTSTASVTGAMDTGGIVGQAKNKGVAACIHTQGTVTGTNWVGGVVGQSAGAVASCENSGNISGESTIVGGIVGQTSGETSYCTNTGNIVVTAENVTYVGGIVAYSYNNIFNSNSSGTITINGNGSTIGGIVGYQDKHTIGTCNSSMVINAPTSRNVGGIAGIAQDNIGLSTFSGYIDADYQVGGIVGLYSATDCIVLYCTTYKDCVKGVSASIVGTGEKCRGWIAGSVVAGDAGITNTIGDNRPTA